MKVLVTGATGFIGGNLARALWGRGYEVRALVRPKSNTLTIDGTGVEQAQGDIRDRESLASAIKGCQAVFHCAAAYTFWARDPSIIYQTNVDGTANVLEAAQRADVSRVVYTSTVSTIGLPEGVHNAGAAPSLGTEESLVSPRHLVGHYKKSKYQAEQMALKKCGDGLPVVVVNPTAPVGPWDVKPTPTGRMVLDFLRGRIPAYVATGMNLVDVGDVAEGHILALEKGRPGQRYLLGNRNVTLMEFFSMLQAATGRRAPRWRIPFPVAIGLGYLDLLLEGVILRREPRIPLEGIKIAQTPMYVSCQKAVAELGLPQTPVEIGLEKAVNWFKDNGYAGQG